jgi:hypothetical protein
MKARTYSLILAPTSPITMMTKRMWIAMILLSIEKARLRSCLNRLL